jgi:hypothetical protein
MVCCPLNRRLEYKRLKFFKRKKDLEFVFEGFQDVIGQEYMAKMREMIWKAGYKGLYGKKKN